MPDSEPAPPPPGNSVRPKTAMDPSQNPSGNQNNSSNGRSCSNQEQANQNSARAGSSGASGAGPPPGATPSKAMVKYGELVILGYNGQLPQGSKQNYLNLHSKCLDLA